jgi:hypothetical protein
VLVVDKIVQPVPPVEEEAAAVAIGAATTIEDFLQTAMLSE